jgi:hypothetical protein
MHVALTAMAEEVAEARVAADTEYLRRMEIQKALYESASIFKQQIWTKVGRCRLNF